MMKPMPMRTATVVRLSFGSARMRMPITMSAAAARKRSARRSPPRPRPSGRSTTTAWSRSRRARVEVRGEVLERGARLGLLLARALDAARGEERAHLAGDLQRLAGRALGRQLEDARPVRVHPQLDDHAPVDALGGALDLDHEDRAEQDQVVQGDA